MNDSEYLPQVYQAFQRSFPEVARALEELAIRATEAGPLDERSQRLIKLAMAIASESPGATRSNVRRAIEAGDSLEELRHVALLAITTCGFPTAIAGLSRIEEVVSSSDDAPDRPPNDSQH